MRLHGYSQETGPSQTQRFSNNVFWLAAEILYADFTNKEAILKHIKGLQLSDSTITRLIKDISKQLMTDIRGAVF
jgi:hypothetical protein